MRIRILGRLMALAAALSVLVLAGCGSPDPKPVTIEPDTSVSGGITVYTSMPQEQIDRCLALFKQNYPNVTVEIVRDTPEALVDRLIAEKGAPVADVVWRTPLTSVMRAAKESVLATYSYPAELYDSVGGDYVDSADRWIGTNARMVTFAVNESKLSGEPPVVFEQLAYPVYAGQFVLPSINTEPGFTMYSSLLVYYDEELANEVFDAIDKNVLYYTDDPEAALDAVVKGEAGLSIGYDRRVVDLQDEGKLKAVFPAIPDVSPWDLDVNGLVNKPSPSEAAKAFLEWAIGPVAMAAYHEYAPLTSVVVSERPPKGYPEELETQLMQPADFEFTSENRRKIIDEWMKRYGSKIKR